MPRRSERLRRKRKLSIISEKNTKKQKFKSISEITPAEIQELYHLYNVFDLHKKMYAFEKKSYAQLMNEETNEYEIHNQNWFHALFLTSIDYSSEYWYPQCSSMHLIKQYIRKTIDIVLFWSEKPDFCYKTNMISIHKCKSVKYNQYCIGIVVEAECTTRLCLRLGLKISEELISPCIEFVEDDLMLKTAEICIVYTSIQKLSYLLFDIMEQYKSVKQFRKSNQKKFQTKFVNKLKQKRHKYTGNLPQMEYITNRRNTVRPSIHLKEQELLRVY